MNFKVAIILMLTFDSVFFGCKKEITKHDAKAEIERLAEQYKLPSLATCVINEGNIVWSNFYGDADIENQILATEETIYHIASISKLIVVTALMQQAEQGKIDIDADINNYIPINLRNTKFPDIPLTARMLMTHTSGVAWPLEYIEAKGLWEQFPPDSAPSLSEWVPQFLVPGGENYNPATWKNTKPGTFELYSNIGTCLQAYIVEQISGMDYRDYCKTHIFQPLDMQNTSYRFADIDSSLLAKRYNTYTQSIYPFADDRLFASGLLKTSVNDFTHFLSAIINDGEYNGFQLLKKETINQILELQNPVSGTSLIWHTNIGDWSGHTGGIDGVSTTAEIHKKDKVGMIIFCNTNSGSVYPGHDIYWLVRQKANEFR